MEYQIRIYVLLLSILNFGFVKTESPPVSLAVNGLSAVLNNGLIKISFNKRALVSSLLKNGKDLVDNTEFSFYFDWNSGRNHRFAPSHLEVITKSHQHVHIMYSQDVHRFLKLEYHLIMKQGLSGIYTYVKVANNNKKPVKFDEMRLVYAFNLKIMHQISNSVEEGTPPSEKQLKKLPEIWDATWKLPNGTIYSKYDYAGYIRNTSYQGVFGNGFGAWMLSPSREYHSGGPLKQDLLVQQGPLIMNYLTGRHFGTPALNAPQGWSKIYGPWLLYFNEGEDDEVKADAIRQSEVEQSLWPYQWMNEPDYPLHRGSLEGKVVSPVRAMVVLTSSLTEPFDLQTLGYSYHTETEKDGSFSIDNIRPGKYKLTAYPIEGYGIGVEAEKLIKISEGKNTGSLELSVPTEVIWSIGETNRRSDSYRYSNERRNYILHTLPSADLEFVVGKSNIQIDWYFAQTHKGTWSIKYNDTPDEKNRKLLIGLAAVSFENVVLVISVNGHKIDQFQYDDNDSATYRCATQSGNFHYAAVTIPANQIVAGENVIKLTLLSGNIMYDSINLSTG